MNAPCLSVVVPVFAVEEYLSECLDSILVHSVPDLEVIAVEDCSPDRCGDILDEYAARDPRLQVVHLERNQGLGAVRNIGLDRATGDYVWFVDSDDRLPPGALPAVLDKLGRDRPDVLVTGFVRTYPGERIEQDVNQPRLLRAAPSGVFGLSEYPALLETIMTAWNKVVRREFLLSLGTRFGGGYYEDIAVTYPLLLTARLSVLEQVCYLYRKGRPGAILQEASPRHFELYAEYERIFGFLDEHPEIPDSLVAAVFARTVRQAATVHATSGLVPAGRRREFFERLTGYFNDRRPASYAQPRGRRGIQYRMLAQGRYLPYTMLLGVNQARLLAGRVLRGTRRLVRRGGGAARTLLYRAFTLLPIRRDLVVYASYWYAGYSDNPKAIYEKARELVPGLHGVWVVKPGLVGSVPEGVDAVAAGSLRYLWVMARAGHLVNNVNFPHNVPKRRGSVHVQTQHGVPVKKMGLDLRDHPVAGAGMDFGRLLRHTARWDYLLSPNQHTSEIWRRTYPGTYRLLEVGQPRTDVLATAGPEQVAAARAALGIEEGRRVFLYAPTFRDSIPGPIPPPPIDRWVHGLGPDDVLLVRAHYFTDGVPAGSPGVDVSEHPDVNQLLLAADVLITDYSSIMFDYAVLDRPIVIYAPDWSDYRSIRGVYLDLFAEPPGAVARTHAELAGLLASKEFDTAAARVARERFRRRFCPYDDGGAAARAVRQIFSV